MQKKMLITQTISNAKLEPEVLFFPFSYFLTAPFFKNSCIFFSCFFPFSKKYSSYKNSPKCGVKYFSYLCVQKKQEKSNDIKVKTMLNRKKKHFLIQNYIYKKKLRIIRLFDFSLARNTNEQEKKHLLNPCVFSCERYPNRFFFCCSNSFFTILFIPIFIPLNIFFCFFYSLVKRKCQTRTGNNFTNFFASKKKPKNIPIEA